jgi:NifU-like protein involved in Fe-S cluster formation
VYSPQVLDHFEHPRNSGILDAPDATVQLENPACGDVLKLMVRFSRQRIAEVRFQAKGCVPAIACGSALTELVEGKTFANADKISHDDVLRKVGGLPDASQHASHLAIDVLKALLRSVNSQTGRVPSGQ